MKAILFILTRNIMNPRLKKYLNIFVWGIFLLTYNDFATEKNIVSFPLYESIKPNVAFWKKVYSEYTTSQVIFHDRRNLTIIYEIVTLKNKNEPGAKKYNKELVDNKKKYYIKLLKRLSSGHAPVSSEEKRIYALFTENHLSGLLKDSYNNIRAQLGQKDRFIAGLIRSGAYLKEMQKIFKSYGLPEDLAYLPHVESSFDYQAYSKFGAAGIWQFTNDTGRRYLKINYTLDERRDPILATRAAARFLKENYEILGSWPIAITAYNHGTQGMLKAVNSHKHYESIFNNYNGRSFGFASHNFYAEFLAAREIAGNFRVYFGDLELKKPVKRIAIESRGYVAIDDLARYFDLPVSTIKDLNPDFREPVYSNQKFVPKGCSIYLPEECRSRLGSASLEIPAKLFKASQKPSLFYRVQRGDTAGKIAKENNVTLKDLIIANQLSPRATVYIGQNLRIPGAGEKNLIVSSRQSPAVKTETVEAFPEQATQKQAERIPLQTSGADKPAPVSSPEIEEADNNIIFTKELPVAMEKDRQINPLTVTGDFSIEKIYKVNGKVTGIIRVEPEETLGHYADWLQIETQKIRRLNGFTYASNIRIGQKIRIPLDNDSGKIFEEKRYEYHKEMEEDFFAAYRVEKTDKYIIKRGDNLWALCNEKFEIPFWLLKKYNPGIDFSRLTARMKLTIPVAVKTGDEGIDDEDQ